VIRNHQVYGRKSPSLLAQRQAESVDGCAPGWSRLFATAWLGLNGDRAGGNRTRARERHVSNDPHGCRPQLNAQTLTGQATQPA
jgi:hypothetical protein